MNKPSPDAQHPNWWTVRGGNFRTAKQTKGTMREIRFKARAVKTKEFVEGLYAIIYETITGDEGEPVGFRQYPSIYVIDEPWRPDGGHWVEIYPQTLCQMTNMTDADGITIWENDRVKVTPIKGKPKMAFEGDVVWMETCFGIEDECGHTMPISNLRTHCKIEVIGNKFDNL